MMEKMRAEFSVLEMAAALDVAPSGFAAHLQKATRLRRQEDARLRPLVIQSHMQSRRTYGSPRIKSDLNDLGIRCGKNRVARLMREQKLWAKQKRRFKPRTTQSDPRLAPAPNLLAGQPKPSHPGRVFQSDITYLPTTEGWLYLAFTIDACTRKVVAYSFRKDLSSELTLTCLHHIKHSQIAAPNAIHHSDRGVQYACSAFRNQLRFQSFQSSMSRPGNPYDNALAESFVATLKTECFEPRVVHSTRTTELMVFDYIESFYNRRRKHSSLGYLSPLQFEQKFPPNQQQKNINT